MSRYHSYINTAVHLIENFKGDQPFAAFIKQFFASNKKYGSKDRKQISSLSYNFFRMGAACNDLPPDQKMLVAVYLCSTQPSDLLEQFEPGWNKNSSLPLHEKINYLKCSFQFTDIFPFTSALSEGVAVEEFCKSFLVQPDLFIRIRPTARISTLKKLEKLKLPFTMLTEDCVQLTVADKLEEYFIIDKEVVVQDYNSQKVLDYLKNGAHREELTGNKSKATYSVWDCCAASGGKSILLYDLLPRKFDLTVSDIRAGIILNLHQRFKKAGIKTYNYFIADITSKDFNPGPLLFDLLICDAPCSGSGTWSRTPEQLSHFKEPAIETYSMLQQKIVRSVLPYLKKDGLFIYITCSVFKKENEDNASWISREFNCTLLQQQLLKGYDKKADSLFVAIFHKN